MRIKSSINPAAGASRVWIVGNQRLHLRIPLMRRLRDFGFEMTAAGTEPNPHFADREFNYFVYPLGRSLNPLADQRAEQKLVELFSHYCPDLVHAVNTKPSILVPRAACRAGLRGSLRTITGLGALFSSSSPATLAMRPIYRVLQRRASQRSALTVFQNRDDRDYFLKHKLVTPERSRLILSSGIDVDAYRQEAGNGQSRQMLRKQLGAEGRLVVTMVARLIKPKGLEEFLEAARLLRRQAPKALFLLIGSPVREGPQTVPVARVKRSEDVWYLGPRSDVPSLLAASDLFVLPSYFREGVPRVLLEAGAMGLPLITTNQPGCKETVRDGWNGRLVPPRNSQALARALRELLASEKKLAFMGRNSEDHIRENFSLSTVAEAYAAVYREILGHAGARQTPEPRVA